MADDTRRPEDQEPEGLDEFLASDPMTAGAERGFQQLGQIPQVKQALDVGQNLDNYHLMVQQAMAGDPKAKAQLAQHSMGTAMGSVVPVSDVEAAQVASKAIPKLRDLAGNQAVTNDVMKAAQEGRMSQQDLAMAMQRQGTSQAMQRPQSFRPKRYAQGGNIDSAATGANEPYNIEKDPAAQGLAKTVDYAGRALDLPGFKTQGQDSDAITPTGTPGEVILGAGIASKLTGPVLEGAEALARNEEGALKLIKGKGKTTPRPSNPEDAAQLVGGTEAGNVGPTPSYHDWLGNAEHDAETLAHYRAEHPSAPLTIHERVAQKLADPDQALQYEKQFQYLKENHPDLYDKIEDLSKPGVKSTYEKLEDIRSGAFPSEFAPGTKANPNFSQIESGAKRPKFKYKENKLPSKADVEAKSNDLLKAREDYIDSLREKYNTFRPLEKINDKEFDKLKGFTDAFKEHAKLRDKVLQKGAPERNLTPGQLEAVPGPEDDTENFAVGGAVGQQDPDTQNAIPSDEPPGLNEFIAPELERAQYQTPGQKILAGEEGLLKGLFGPIGSAIVKGVGSTSEEIQGREEANPLIHYGTEAAGLLGPAVGAKALGAAAHLTQAGALEAVGGAGARALGLGAEGAGAASKIGSAAVKGAIENGIFQGSDEVSKKILNDPGQTAESAVSNMGMAALLGGGIGGAFGSVSPLWKATAGPKVEQFLSSVTDRINGHPIGLPEQIDAAIRDSGIQVDPTVRAAMSGDPELAKQFNILREGKNTKVISSIEDLQTKASDAMMGALGKTPEDVMNYSEAEQGRAAMDTFKQEFKTRYEPIQKEYDSITKAFKESELPQAQNKIVEIPVEQREYPRVAPEYTTIHTPGAVDFIADKIATMAQEKGYTIPQMPQTGVINTVLKALPLQKTIQDLANLGSVVRDMTSHDSSLWNVGKEVKNIIMDSQQELLGSKIAKESPELFDRYKAVRGAYADLSRVKDEAAQNLSLGRTGGPEGFLAKLAEKRSPEEFLRKLSPKANAEIIPFLQKNFPSTLEKIRENELYKLASPSVRGAPSGHTINGRTLNNAIDKMSPEMRQFALPEGAARKIEASQELLHALPTFKSSGTAGWLDSLMKYMPASGAAAASMLLGHSPVAGFLLGHASKLLARDAPDAVRLAMLKFLGSSEPIESGAFKTMAEYFHNVYQGETKIQRATKAVFKPGVAVLSQSQMPSERERVKLDKILKSLHTDQMPLVNVGGQTGHYLPEHGTALGQFSSTAVNYLNSQRPESVRQSPLDQTFPISTAQKAQYDQTLNVAEQPLVVLDKIKEGTITTSDIKTLTAVYPNLYHNIAKQLTAEMIASVSKGNIIPYKTRIGLSMYLAQPLDSTLQASSIIAAQPKPPEAEQGSPSASAARPKKSMTALNKLPGTYRTPDQNRQAMKAENKA